MPTFDQLPAEQRAIIELVVQRGRSYDALADALQITPERVRELAHDALVELSPRTAERVDPDRRAQIADYVLNQQSTAESRATRSHLKRSEAGRMWILSLLDSLEHMYENGTAPEVPAAEAEEPAGRARQRERPRERARDRDRVRDRERPRERERPLREEPRRRERLGPEAEEALRRRRLAGLVGGLLILGAIIAVVLALVIDTEVHEAGTPQTRVVGQLLLNPLNGGNKNQGIAIVAQRGDDQSLIVQARLNPTQKDQAYEVWLYNSDKDAVSLGAQVTDKNGNYQGAGRLPAPLDRYKYIDVSLEKLDRNTAHSGNSVLRGETAKIQSPQEAAQQQGQQGQQPPPAGGGGGQPQPPAGGGQQP